MKKSRFATKTLAVFLTVLLLLSVAPLAAMSDALPKLDLDFDFAVTAHATGDTPYLTSGYCGDTSDGQDGKNIAWSLDADGALTLTGTGKMGSTPNRDDLRITALSIGDGITSVIDYAFINCKNLSTVIIPNTVTEIGDYAFSNCGLTELIIPDSVESIGRFSFDNNLLRSINFGSGLEVLSDSSFKNNKLLSRIELGPNIRDIGYDTFANCEALLEIVFSEGLERIGDCSFYETGVETLVFPESLEFIDMNSFNGCNNLLTVSFGKNTSFISWAAFQECNNLLSISVDPNNEHYYSYDGALYQRDTEVLKILPLGKEEVTVSSTCRDIDPDILFSYDNKIEKFFVSDQNTSIEAYNGVLYTVESKELILCPKCVEECQVKEGTKSIRREAFKGCKAETIVLPDSIKEIGAYAFYFSRSLQEINIPAEVERIDECAFIDCNNLSIDVILPDSCLFVGRDAFSRTAIKSLYIGSGLKTFELSTDTADKNPSLETIVVSANNNYFSSFDGALYSKDYETLLLIPNKTSVLLHKNLKNVSTEFLLSFTTLDTIVVEEDSSFFSSSDGILYNKDGTILIACPAGKTGTVEVPNGVLEIGKSAFYHGNIRAVVLPNTVRKLGVYSFAWSQLQSINIPGSVKSIELGCFDSSKLTTLSIEDGVEKLGGYAFFYCRNLKEAILPQSVKTIGEHCFCGCDSLNTLILPENMTYLGNIWLTSNRLEEITFPSKLQTVDLTRWNLPSLKQIVFLNPHVELLYSDFYSIPSDTKVSALCGSTGHEFAVKHRYPFTSLGHTWLNWYVAQPATFDADGIEQRDCAYCGAHETRVIPKLERETFTATFVADGNVVAQIDFPKDAVSIEEPAVPAKDRYTGCWEDYTLSNADLTINAVYTLITSGDASEIETESSATHYIEADNVLFRMKAYSAAKTVKSIVSQSVPLDIVLVVDQSGSMEDPLGGNVKKVDALKAAAHEFVDAVAANAALTGADHRISVVGFGLAGKYSGYLDNENTELLTSGRGVVPFADITPADYAASLISINNKATLDAAIDGIEARGATAADLGLEMAKGVFSNSDSTGRDRIVVFMTDGAPTYQSSFQTAVANSAVANAKLLKSTYGALVYSVGIFSSEDARNANIRKFMQAVSSNYPNAYAINVLGNAEADSFFTTVNDTSALSGVFRTITTESLSHTASFDNVSLIKTLSRYVTLTAPQEQTLRVDAIRKYGISNDRITITRNADGTTTIRLDGLTPYEVIDDEGNITYEVSLEFFASLNENAAAAAAYIVDDEDSGIMLGDAVGYEATFSTSEITLSEAKTWYLFTINGELYEIAEGSTVSAAVPETDFAADWQFSGWNTTGVSNANGTIIDATLVKAPRTVIWHTADGDIQQFYTEGQFLTPPEVADRADGSKFLSWNKSLPTVMLDQDLEFTAIYGDHVHKYSSEDEIPATCTANGLRRFTCICGDNYTEVLPAFGHDYEAITPSTEQDASRCTFVCNNCGLRYEYALNYEIKVNTYQGRAITYEFQLTDDDLNIGFEPDGSIVIRIPLSEFQSGARNVRVKRTVNGHVEQVPAEIKDGFLIITADHFTPYDIELIFACMETGEHVWVESQETKPATCTEEGEMTYICELCQTPKTEPINKKDHTPGEWFIDQAATCKETGSKHQECSVCHNTIATDTIEKNAGNHADYGTRLENARAATCKEDGYTGDTYCKGCNSKVASGSTISKDTIAHTRGPVVRENEQAATTDHGGSYDEVVRCTACGKVLSSTHKTTDKLPSQPQSNPNACKYCGEVHSGPFGWLIKFFHSILAAFGLRKQ